MHARARESRHTPRTHAWPTPRETKASFHACMILVTGKKESAEAGEVLAWCHTTHRHSGSSSSSSPVSWCGMYLTCRLLMGPFLGGETGARGAVRRGRFLGFIDEVWTGETLRVTVMLCFLLFRLLGPLCSQNHCSLPSRSHRAVHTEAFLSRRSTAVFVACSAVGFGTQRAEQHVPTLGGRSSTGFAATESSCADRL